MNESVPRYLFHNGGWWVRRDESPVVPHFRDMDQRLSAAVTRYLPDPPPTNAPHQPKPPGRDAR
jgi:hypothetical protein